MGRVTVTVEVGNPQADRFREVEVIVDSGATLSSIPADTLQDLGIQVARTDNARLANNTRMPVDIGGATIRVEGITIRTDVIFAEPGSPSLLGVVALETADLGVDPKMRKLIRLSGPDMLTVEASEDL